MGRGCRAHWSQEATLKAAKTISVCDAKTQREMRRVREVEWGCKGEAGESSLVMFERNGREQFQEHRGCRALDVEPPSTPHLSKESYQG